MQHAHQQKRRSNGGYALLMALGFMGVMLVMLAGLLQWTSTSAATTSRNNLYNSAVYAAEAATEKVLARMDRDFINQSLGTSLSSYINLSPTQAGWPLQFEFSDGTGVIGKTGVLNLNYQVVTNLDSQFAGLYGMVNTYRVTSRAQPINGSSSPAATVSQKVQFALIPVFQFAIFYNLDLEINPGANMVVTGKVHSNGNIYSAPPSPLEFKDDVGAVGQIYNSRSTNDPTGGSKTQPVFDKSYLSDVSSLNLPIGTSDNSPSNVVQILDPPPAGESPSSPLGQARLYNNATLIISNSASGTVAVKAGQWDNFAPVAPDVTNKTTGATSYSFVTTATFYDYREQKQVNATQIDVGKYRTWLAKNPNGGSTLNAAAQASLNHGLDSIYVLNQQSGGGLAAVRVANGSQLPDGGLTVATPLPLYVDGNYNLNNGDTTPGQSNTAQTQPAAFISDAVTILSSSWKDTYNSSTALNSRNAGNTTVNAAFITGIVPSGADTLGGLHYSGGVENLPRLLENWTGDTLTYNGSMVVMFPSRYATKYWRYGDPIYTAATRKWAFDLNFLNQNRLPPLTPSVRKLVRGQWQVLASN